MALWALLLLLLHTANVNHDYVTFPADIFLPCPDSLLVNLHESRSLVVDLLNQLPTLFENNMETRSALGAALQAAYKMTVGSKVFKSFLFCCFYFQFAYTICHST